MLSSIQISDLGKDQLNGFELKAEANIIPRVTTESVLPQAQYNQMN